MINWAYLAGFIDCDGWITYSERTIRSGLFRAYTVGFTQSINYKEQMEQVKQFLLDSEVRCTLILRRKNWKSELGMVNIMVKHQESVVRLLTAVEPFLLFKKTKALEGIQHTQARLAQRLPAQESTRQRAKTIWREQDVNVMLQWHRKGYSNSAIGAKLERSDHAVAGKLLRLGVTRCRNL